jgi:Ca2+-binding RTX toxin-like protein
MGLESGFNPNARSTSATEYGLGQWTDETWVEAVQKYNQNFGGLLDPAASRTNPDDQVRVFGAWLQELWGRAEQRSSDPSLGSRTLPEFTYGLWHDGQNSSARRIHDFLDNRRLTFPQEFADYLRDTYNKSLNQLDPAGVYPPLEFNPFLTPEQWKSAFDQAESTPTPIVLDLDGDGTESVSVAAGAYFDHDADGFAEATGWAGADDGLLVWDRDGDGRIESGRELFGDRTLLQSGLLAANGFAALAEWDGNADGRIDAADPVWANLKLWKDIDGDGFSAADEFLSLTEAGVASINLAYATGPGVDANGNSAWLSGSFTRSDGTSGAATDYLFERDSALTIPEEWLAVPAPVAALPDATGFGKVYDLHQAMVRDATAALQGLVASFVNDPNPLTRNTSLEQIIFKWTGAEAVNPSGRGPFIDGRRVAALEAFAGRDWVNIYTGSYVDEAAAQQLQQAWASLFESLYAQLMAQSHLQGLYDQVTYFWDSQAQALRGDLAAVETDLVSALAADQVLGAIKAHEFIRTIKGLGAEGTLDLDSLRSSASLAWILDNFGSIKTVVGTSGADAITGASLYDFISAGAGNDTINGGSGGPDTIDAGAGDDTVYVYQAASGEHVVLGGAGNDVLSLEHYANATLDGGAGDDWVRITPDYTPESHTTRLIGGAGTDRLEGGNSADTYVFGRGDGQDVIRDRTASAASDAIELGAGIAPADVRASRSGLNLVLDFLSGGNPSADRLTVENWYAGARIEQLRFADATVWTASQLESLALAIWGTEGADTLQGYEGSDTIYGLGGNDTINGGSGGPDTIDAGAGDDTVYVYQAASGEHVVLGGAGNDVLSLEHYANATLDGGAGDDWVRITPDYTPESHTTRLIGGAGTDRLEGGNSADTYVFGRGDGQDVIRDRTASAASDAIELGAGIAPADVRASRSGLNLVLDFLSGGNPSADRLTVENWYAGARIEQLRFADGTVVTAAQLEEAATLVSGSSSDDQLAGWQVNNALQGLEGNDALTDTAGNNLLDGGAGNDSITGGAGNDLIAGGAGDDAIQTGAGYNLVAFNAGGGTDTVYSAAGASNTLSFGGGIGYSDLSLSKQGNDLIVNAGAQDKVVLKDWYAGANNFLNLQIILDASDEFDANSSDPLYNRKVQTFNFAGLVSAFDQALVQSPGLTSWAVTNALLEFHLSGSDAAALGGDLAYWYGKNGAFTGIGIAAAQELIGAVGFGADAQTLRPFSGLQEGFAKLA